MPALQVRTEGKRNGVKTNLANLTDVSRALGVKTEYPLRFFGSELGTQVEYKNNRGKESAIINGQHTAQMLQRLLDKFIEIYVLCPKCNYPEINILVRKSSQTLYSDCKSCGHRQKMNMRHKLSTFILKNPPPPPPKVAKVEKVASVEKPQESNEDQHFEEVQALGPDSAIVVNIVDNIISYGEQGSFSELVNHVKNLSISAGLEMDMRIYVALKGIFGSSIVQGLRDEDKCKFLQEIAVDHAADFLMAFAYVYVPQTDLHRFFPTALKLAYDLDILPEDFLLEWNDDRIVFNENSPVYSEDRLHSLRQLSQQFLQWLQTADEESGSEEEEEEEENPEPVEVVEETPDNRIDIIAAIDDEDIDLDDI